MFKHITLTRRGLGLPSNEGLAEQLANAAFTPCGPTQQQSAGWLPPRNGGSFVEAVGNTMLARFQIESRVVPPSALARELDAKADAVQNETGRRPKGKRLKELREEVLLALLPRAFTRISQVNVLVNRESFFIAIGSATQSTVDMVATALSAALGQVLLPVQTVRGAPLCMATWLSQQEGPAGFSLDRECELKQPDGEKARVRYSHHNLEIGEIGEHLKQGKVPTQVALTYQGRASFILADRPSVTLRSIKLLDVVFEGGRDHEDQLAADLALYGAEIHKLTVDLIAEMGGLRVDL
jgi:recombination associated protein RdgC